MCYVPGTELGPAKYRYRSDNMCPGGPHNLSGQTAQKQLQHCMKNAMTEDIENMDGHRGVCVWVASPVTTLLLLSSESTLHCLLCDNGDLGDS